MAEVELQRWEHLRDACQDGRMGIFRRLHVAPQVDSTQDVARSFAGGSEGLAGEARHRDGVEQYGSAVQKERNKACDGSSSGTAV